MSVSSLTNTAQDYLKVIWAANEWGSAPVTVTALAARIGVRAATVSDGIRRLTEQGLVVHEPYGAVALTEQGRMHALAMVRRHRLIETFLVETLGTLLADARGAFGQTPQHYANAGTNEGAPAAWAPRRIT